LPAPFLFPHIAEKWKNEVGVWECWNVSEKEKAEIGNVDKIRSTAFDLT
jgi:hypothetical protein